MKYGSGEELGNTLPAAQHNVPNTGGKSNDSAGVQDGLSMRSGFSAEDGNIHPSNERDPMTGNPMNRITQNPMKTSATKRGKKFDIC